MPFAGALGQYALGQFKPPDDSAVVSTTLGALTGVVTGQAIVDGQISTTLGGLSSVVTGQAIVDGQISTTLDDLTGAETVQAIVDGQISTTLDDLTGAETVQAVVDGEISTTLDGITSQIVVGPVSTEVPLNVFSGGYFTPPGVRIVQVRTRTKIVGWSQVSGISRTRKVALATIEGFSETDFIGVSRAFSATTSAVRKPTPSVAVQSITIDHGWNERDRRIRHNNRVLLMS